MRDVAAYLLARIEEYSANQELSDLLNNLHQLYVKRLWHQLTEVLLALVQRPELQDGDKLWQLYTNVIADFELKLNPLSLVEMCIPIVERLTQGDPEEALQFLEKMGDKVKANTEAFVMAKILMGRIHLMTNDLPKTKALLETTETLLDEIEGVGIVHGRFYLLLSELAQKDADHKGYYRAALHFLGCTDLSTLSVEEQRTKAYLLSIAALLGKDVYNFGELLAHPVLSSLNGTDSHWIVDLLHAFNSGNVQLFASTKPQWTKESALAEQEAILLEKIRLLGVMEMTFRRDANDRQLTFKDIAAETGLNIDDVELLVMKCLAKGLVKGQIDQVSGTVDLVWVQPRVLDREQLKTIQSKIGMLTTSLCSMENLIEQTAGEILTV